MARGRKKLSNKAERAGAALRAQGGRTATGEWASERDFFDADKRRGVPVHDLGFGWREGEQSYRISWLPETGELYAVQISQAGEERTLLLGQFPDEQQLHALFDGYYRHLRRAESLLFVRESLAAALASPTIKAGARGRPSALSAG